MNTTEHKPTLRVISVLELVASGNHKYTLSEMAKALSIPASTLFPIVRTLTERQYLSFHAASQTYSLGLRLFETGSRIQDTGFYASLIEIMQTIVDSCGETCHFGVLSCGDVLYLAKVNSPQMIRMFSMIGRRLPAYGTSIGKALLRDYSMEDLKRLYPDGLKPLTPRTITDFNTLFQQLQAVKKNLFAYENEESNENIRCIAIPVCCSGTVVAALSVAVPVFRYTEEGEAQIERLLKDAAPYVERLLPYMNL